MSRFEQVAAKLEEYGLDAMLVLSEPNRLYVTGFQASDGAALVTKRGSWFFTDSRYIEAARRAVTGAAVAENTAKSPVTSLVNQVLEQTGARRLGYEDAYTTVADYRRLSEKLEAELVGATGLLTDLRMVKDAAEVETLIAAQRIKIPAKISFFTDEPANHKNNHHNDSRNRNNSHISLSKI